MDPDTANQIAEILAVPSVGELAKRLLGPSADHLGERLRDCLKRCIDRSDGMLAEANAAPEFVEPRLLLPLIQAALAAEDETLLEMFAALIANARLCQGVTVRPAFISILSQLAPDEAVLLQALGPLTAEYQEACVTAGMGGFHTKGHLDAARARAINDAKHRHQFQLDVALPPVANETNSERTDRMDTCLLVLAGLQLVDNDGVPLLSSLGRALLHACTPPKGTAG